MSKVIQEASQELIAKLVRAGYLQPALRHDADAVSTAIARLKEDLRGGRDDEDRPR
jgi:hypothetical protein